MKFDILLLNPPTTDSQKFVREGRCTQQIDFWGTLWPPISLATIGAVLLQDNFGVQIFDCPAQEISLDFLKNIIAAQKPNVVIWSTGTPTIENDLGLADIIKKVNSSIATIVFGTHVTALAQECLERYPALDFIARNEPEYSIRKLVNCLNDKKAIHEIKGISFRTSKDQIKHNPDREYIRNPDELPEPAWQLIDINRYRLPITNKKYLIIAPFRGCPFKCTFCTAQTYYSNQLRKRSVDVVLTEIKHNMEKYHIQDFFFWADTFTVNKKYVTELCNKIINSNLNIRWTCNARVDTVDESMFNVMAKAGCWMVSFGIESGNQEILDGVKKGIKIEQAFTAVTAARKAGIKTVGHFILGLPGETHETIEETIAFSRKLGLDFAQFYCAVPFPGSKLYDEAISNHWLSDTDWQHFSQNSAIMNFPEITAEEVNEYRKKAASSFYYHLPTVWRLFLVTIKIFSFRGFIVTIYNHLINVRVRKSKG